MAATFAWIEYLANATATATPTNLNFGSTITANLAPSTFPITAGTYSYEKWVTTQYTGSFTRIENIQFWKSAGAYVSAEQINFTGQIITYAVPTTSSSTYAAAAVATSDPGTSNVSIGGSLTGSLVATGASDFLVLQTSVGSGASAGAVNQKTFTLQYDEV